MTRNEKQRLSCAVLLIVGLGLIIGGAFIPVLLIPGVPVFVGGLGVLAAIVEDKDKIAFNTTINNINNYDGEIQSTRTERIRAKFNFGPSVGQRIGEWNDKLRDLFATAPKELGLTGNDAPVLTFTHNYQLGKQPLSKVSKLLIEDITHHDPQPAPFVPVLSAIEEVFFSEDRHSTATSAMPELEHLDLNVIEQTYAPPKEMEMARM